MHIPVKPGLAALCVFVTLWLLAGCAGSAEPTGLFGSNTPTTAAGQNAASRAEGSRYRPAVYRNVAKKGPRVIVHNPLFYLSTNNIADFGELELTKAHFGVLERQALGTMVNEMQTAYALGNAAQARRLYEKGSLKSTRWIVKFDILKAEAVTEASNGFDGGALSRIVDIVGGGSKAAQVGSTTVDSTRTRQEAKAWLVGMRYKVLDAATTEQVATGYFEERMNTGQQSTSVLGVSSGSGERFTLDFMRQHRTYRSAICCHRRFLARMILSEPPPAPTPDPT